MGGDFRRRRGSAWSHRYFCNAGSRLGTSAVSPWSFKNPAPATFGTAAAIWLIVTQWLSSAFGGYLTGRLRKKWVGIRTDEVVFRDTAHGLLAWALATLMMATLDVGFDNHRWSGGQCCGYCFKSAPATAEATEQARKLGIAFAFTTSLSLSYRRICSGCSRCARRLPLRRRLEDNLKGGGAACQTQVSPKSRRCNVAPVDHFCGGSLLPRRHPPRQST